MNDLLEKSLHVRYTKLNFMIRFPEYCIVPVSKTSALRGGIGEMLLRAHCVKDRVCETCDFLEECIVQRTMYSRFIHKPEFMTTGASIGYVIECENYQEHMEAGEEMEFKLLLFGKTIVYLSEYLSAIYALGNHGLGKYHARFVIKRITNTRGRSIMDGNNIYMTDYQAENLKSYVEARRKLVTADQDTYTVVFKTATTMKYHGEFLQKFDADAIVQAACRRLYMLSCFENIDNTELMKYAFKVPEILNQTVKHINVKRFSNRQESSMFLRGIRGSVVMTSIDEEVLDLLLAAEVFHLGKNTHFGFGKIRIR